MWEDNPVARFKLIIHNNEFWVENLEIINPLFLPISYTENHSIKCLLKERLYLNGQNVHNDFLPTFFKKVNDRLSIGPFILSLHYNSANLADKYWLNPDEDVEVEYCKTIIYLKHKKSYADVDFFSNRIDNTETEKLNQMMFFYKENRRDFLKMDIVRTPLFTTNGMEIKRWIIKDNQYVLQKKYCIEDYNKEKKCLDFFHEHGVLTPDLIAEQIQFNDIEEQLTESNWKHIVASKPCLTDKNSYLVPAQPYVEHHDGLEQIVEKILKNKSFDKDEVNNFIKVFTEYTRNSKEMKRTDNFGFFIKDEFARPVVWSRVL